MRFYIEKVPEEGNVIACRIVSNEFDYYKCQLVEYDNVEGTLMKHQLINKREKITTNQIIFCRVYSSKDVLLTRRDIEAEDIKTAEEKYLRASVIESIFRYSSNNDNHTTQYLINELWIGSENDQKSVHECLKNIDVTKLNVSNDVKARLKRATEQRIRNYATTNKKKEERINKVYIKMISLYSGTLGLKDAVNALDKQHYTVKVVSSPLYVVESLLPIETMCKDLERAQRILEDKHNGRFQIRQQDWKLYLKHIRQKDEMPISRTGIGYLLDN